MSTATATTTSNDDELVQPARCSLSRLAIDTFALRNRLLKKMLLAAKSQSLLDLHSCFTGKSLLYLMLMQGPG